MTASEAESAPRFLNLSLRWRITLPFLLLAFALGLGAAYFVLRVLQESAEDRFLRQLADSGQQSVNAVVALERELLEVERLIANSAGLPQAVIAQDAEALRALVLPLALNAELNAVTVVDEQGVSLLSARSRLGGGPGSYETVRGEGFYADWPFVAQVLQFGVDSAEKRVGIGVVQQGGRELPVLFIVGPVANAGGQVIGAILVGQYLENTAADLAQASGANISLYEPQGGELWASTLAFNPERPPALPQAWAEAARQEDEGTPVRQLEIAGTAYREALLSFEARSGQDRLGVLGVSLLDTVRGPEAGIEGGPGQETVRWVIGFGALGLLLIGAVGLAISNSIARPLEEIARATSEISRGNLDIEVPERGGGEVTVVARSFNEMLRGLRASASGEYRPESVPLPTADRGHLYEHGIGPPEQGEPIRAAQRSLTLMALEIRLRPGDNEPSERNVAQAFDRALAVVQGAVERHRGQLVSFDGLRGLAVFGLSQPRQPASVQALLGCHAACEIAEKLTALDIQRQVEGQRGVQAAIALHAGEAVRAAIGKKYGLASDLFGDTVVITQELIGPARQAAPGAILLSGRVREQLAAARSQFDFGRKGVAALGTIGRDEIVYEVAGRHEKLITDDEGPMT